LSVPIHTLAFLGTPVAPSLGRICKLGDEHEHARAAPGAPSAIPPATASAAHKTHRDPTLRAAGLVRMRRPG